MSNVADLFSFLYCFCFVCLDYMSCVPNVANVSGLSILNCPVGFLYRLFVFMLFDKKKKKNICWRSTLHIPC